MGDQLNFLGAHSISSQHHMDLLVRCETLADGENEFLWHVLEAVRLVVCLFLAQDHQLEHGRRIRGDDTAHPEDVYSGDYEGWNINQVDTLQDVHEHFGREAADGSFEELLVLPSSYRTTR